MNRTSLRVLAVSSFGAAVLFVATAMADDNATVKPSESDYIAVHSARIVRHARPANTPKGETFRSTHFRQSARGNSQNGSSSQHNPIKYPGDLTFHGGQVVDSAEFHAIYLRPNGVCPISTCWGDPEGFLQALGKSDLIHVVDQYVGLHADNRYTVGSHRSISFTPSSTPFTDDDIAAFVHAVAKASGETGYGHIYHVFLPKGTDECFDSSFTTCYSPDNLASFAFCAYHSSADFQDIGHVLYSVEPYQDVNGCQDVPGTPNGQRIDSQNDTLSHETIETITDPDGDAWWVSAGFGLYGQEIADECIFIDDNFFSIPDLFRVNGKTYAAQPEYSNQQHGCVGGVD